MKLSYKDAGVDKTRGYESVRLIKDMVRSTCSEHVYSSLGGFSGMYDLSKLPYEEPVLVSGTDGVGTKVDLAFRCDKHDTVGIDAVAMCVNDILCQGAKPLFFLDYIASGRLKPEKIAAIVSGVVEGCLQSGASLIGGETAEMPGIYDDNEYDLAGFAVGIVDKKKIIDGSKVRPGDKIVGLKSSGLHSNGFSLVRKIVFDVQGFDVDYVDEDLGVPLGEALLVSARIYVKPVLRLLEDVDVHALSHITGGGFYENIPRVLGGRCDATIDLAKHEVPLIFKKVQEWGGVETKEMYSTFNMGTGMILLVAPEDLDKTLEILEAEGEACEVLGEVSEGTGEVTLCGL